MLNFLQFLVFLEAYLALWLGSYIGQFGQRHLKGKLDARKSTEELPDEQEWRRLLEKEQKY